MSVSIEKTGLTVTEAVNKALEELKVSIDDAVIEVLEDNSEFEGISNRPCRVLVTIEDNTPRYFGDEADVEDHDSEEVESVAKDFVTGVFTRFGLPANMEISHREDALDIDVLGEEFGIIIGRGGETLAALQYLTSLVVNKNSNQSLHVHLDIAGYRKRQEDKLASLARRTAAKVARSKRTFEMNPMSSAERRIIHSALQNFRGVETFSEGEGSERRVIIAPSQKNA